MRMIQVRVFSVSLLLLALVVGGEALTEQQRRQAAAPVLEALPPVGKGSVKFLVIGDSGTGDRAQIETAAMMWRARSVFP